MPVNLSNSRLCVPIQSPEVECFPPSYKFYLFIYLFIYGTVCGSPTQCGHVSLIFLPCIFFPQVTIIFSLLRIVMCNPSPPPLHRKVK
jgi:hypothetical protein